MRLVAVALGLACVLAAIAFGAVLSLLLDGASHTDPITGYTYTVDLNTGH